MMNSSKENSVYVLILNWNGWRDTIECLESVFRNDYPKYRVIVCDNNSTDQSLDQIKLWAHGKLKAVPASKDERLTILTAIPASKPITYCEYNRVEAESGGRQNDQDGPLVLIQTGMNLGYAAGCNVGLRYVAKRGDFDYIWLLNNDTLIRPDALSQLVKKMGTDPSAGVCGSRLLYYHKPEKIQAAGGGGFDKTTGVTWHLESSEPADKSIDEDKISNEMSYVVGASMLISRPFLQKVGLLSEEYFLYFEELDWAIRSRNIFKLVFASKSIVYHKEGASTQFNGLNENSFKAHFYYFRNRLLFVRKYFPIYLPSNIYCLLLELIRSLRARQYVISKAIVFALFGITPK